MRRLTIAIIVGLLSTTALAQQKKSQAKPKTCTYEQCVAANTGKGWSSSQVSNWCSGNPGKCQ